MSAPQPAASVAEPRAFNCIPNLSEMLPEHQGLPGFTYLILDTSSQYPLEQLSWLQVEGTVTGIIKGPEGESQFRLYCRGNYIPGESPFSSKRSVHLDCKVLQATGLDPGESDYLLHLNHEKEQCPLREKARNNASGLPTLLPQEKEVAAGQKE